MPYLWPPGIFWEWSKVLDTQKELHHAEPDGNEMSEEVSSSTEVVAGGATDEDEDAEGEDEEDENDGDKEKDEEEKEKDEGEKEKNEGEEEEDEGEEEEDEEEEEEDEEKEEEDNEKDEIEDEMEIYEKVKLDVDMEKGKDEVAHSSPIMEDDLVNDEDFMKEMDNNMMAALRDANSDI